MNWVRSIFSVSFAIGIFWLLGFIAEPILHREPPAWSLSLSSLLITVILMSLVFRRCPNFLKRCPEENVSSTKYYIMGIFVSYFLLIPFCALLSYLLVQLYGNVNHHESGMFIGMFAIWFPLWWFVPVGLLVGWIFYRRKCVSIRSDPADGEQAG